MSIKPIETVYNGYRFRSRLEARWAVFFDALHVPYEYEPEGFELPSGKHYLPDFRVKCWGTRGEIWDEPFDLYIEVKGEMTEYDAERIIEFANIPEYSIFDSEEEWIRKQECANPVLIVGNIPPRYGAFSSTAVKAYEQMNGIDIYPFNYELIDGDYFAAYPTADNGKFFLCGDDSNYMWNQKEAEEAYLKARQARFEHGETPII